jgi:hypothetical protein
MQDISLTHTNFNQVEKACLDANQVVRTHGMDTDAQTATVAQLLKQFRTSHHKDHPHFGETKAVLDKVVAAKKVDTLLAFTGALQVALLENRKLAKAAAEAGIFHPPAVKREGASSEVEPHPKRATKPSAELEPPVTWCHACGRKGHKSNRCDFVAQGHPDVNPDHSKRWCNSKQGIAWKALGKNYLPGNLTLSGAPFTFTKVDSE